MPDRYRGSHASSFTVYNDRIFSWILFKMRHPQGHIVETKLAKCHVEIHFERGGAVGKCGNFMGVVRSCADILSVIAAGFAFRRVERQIKRLRVENGRLGIWHRQYHRESTGQCGGCARIPVFFMSRAGFAEVDMRVDETGEFKHVSGSRYQGSGGQAKKESRHRLS